MRFSTDPQGSEAWLAARRGAITGSRARDARDKTAKGVMSAKARLYAMDTARERVGGTVLQPYVNAAMRIGTEQEEFARRAYEAETGDVVESAGFISTDDGHFGVSVDGLVGRDGIVEIKTAVSSDTLFTAAVERDVSAYRDQVLMSMWILARRWADIVIWAPDLEHIGRALTVIRIERDEPEIERFEADLLAFDATVEQYRSALLG